MLRFLLDTNLCIRVLRDRPAQIRDRCNAEVERFTARVEILPFGEANPSAPAIS